MCIPLSHEVCGNLLCSNEKLIQRFSKGSGLCDDSKCLDSCHLRHSFFFTEVLMLLVIAGAFKHLDSDVLLENDQSIDELPFH